MYVYIHARARGDACVSSSALRPPSGPSLCLYIFFNVLRTRTTPHSSPYVYTCVSLYICMRLSSTCAYESARTHTNQVTNTNTNTNTNRTQIHADDSVSVCLSLSLCAFSYVSGARTRTRIHARVRALTKTKTKTKTKTDAKI